jgi:hypothetical protein
MGLLATSMGLQEGPEGMKKLTQMMKQGKIGMKELFNFLDMAAKRAKETGAYDKAINSKQAAETRMSNSYKLFSDAFITFFDDNIKGTFNNFSESLDNLTKMFEVARREEQITGMIGEKKTQFEYVMYLFKTAGEGLMLGVESFYQLANRFGFKNPGTMQQTLADRQVIEKYYAAKGANTPSARAGLAGAGYPGIDAIIAQSVAAVGGDRYYQQQYLEQFRQRNGIPNKPVNMGQDWINANAQDGTLSGKIKALGMQYGIFPNMGAMGMYTKPAFSDSFFNNLSFTPNITVIVDGVAISKDSIDAQISNAFGNSVKPL